MILSQVTAARRALLERERDAPTTAHDRDRFNALLSAAQRERPRDVLVRALDPIPPDQHPGREELVDRYNRLALAFDEGAHTAGNPHARPE